MDQDNLANLISNLAEQVRLLRIENAETQQAVHVFNKKPTTQREVEEHYIFLFQGFSNGEEEDNKESGTNHKELPDITFALEVRLLLADAASNITQLRIELVYKTMDLPGKAPKLAEKTNDSLFEPKQSDTVVETKKIEQRKPRLRKRRLFFQRQQVTYDRAPASAQYFQQNATHNTSSTTASSLNPQEFKTKIFKARGKSKSSQASEDWLSGILQQSVYNTKKAMQTKTGTGWEKTQLLRLVQELQDLQEIPEVYVEQNEPTVYNLSFGLFLKFIDDSHKINPPLRNDNKFKINSLKDNLKQDLGLETKSCKIIENRQNNFKRISQLSNAMSTSGIKEQDINGKKISELHSKHNKCEQLYLGNNTGKEQLFRVMGKRFHIGTYQLQGTINNNVCLETTSSNRKINSDILGQYDIISVCKETGRYYFRKITEDSRRHMGILHQDKHPPADVIYSNIHESSRCTVKTNCTDRVVYFNGNIQKYQKDIWPTRYRYIFFEKKQENRELLQLVQGHTGNRNKRTPALLEEIEKPILLPVVELNSSSITESNTRENNIENNNSSLDFGNMAFNTDQVSNIGPSKYISVRDSARPKKRKITTNQKQDMVFNSMENQWGTLQEEGLSDIAINLITSNKRPVKRRYINYTIQKEFIDRRSNNNRYNKITVPDIINYLSKILVERELKNLSIKAYKSVLLQLVTNKEMPKKKKCLKEFMDYLNDTTIITANKKYFNIRKASDIHRIDDTRTEVLEHSLKLLVLAPKKKKKEDKVANALCPRSHVKDKNLAINHFFINSRDHNKQLSVDSISRIIKPITIVGVNNKKA
ncbi:hypothetical protein BB561_004607 [Smittium simulii]|uniref:Uncharacterized protein n=1 Tax=Smittium simulii TaxID=133385 RepID=A0A2T9YF86_9FUNG|nr:hypothetical protein BB561_004607 [Smittium simulii]